VSDVVFTDANIESSKKPSNWTASFAELRP
jgi:hypothetical protein